MTSFRYEDGGIKWHIVATFCIILVTIIGILGLSWYVDTLPEKVQAPIVPPVVNNNEYNTNNYVVGADKTPIDVIGCSVLEVNSGGYAIVCRK